MLAVGSYSYSQNIAVNTTGTAAAAANMLEVTQPAGAPSDYVGIFARNLSAATNAYAIWAEATGATNKYAIVVPPGGGNVGIGTTTPTYSKLFVLQSTSNAATDNFGIQVEAYQNAVSGNTLRGLSILANFNAAGTLQGVNGLNSTITVNAGSTVNYCKAISPWAVVAGTVGDLRMVDISGPLMGGAGIISNLWGIYVGAPGAGGTITNKYALVTEANAGNVGIGTTDPLAKLEVASDGTAFTYPTMGQGRGSLHISPVAGTNDNTTSLTFGANNAGAPWNSGAGEAGIYVQSSGAYGTKMYFGTTQSYATGSQARMMIDHLGNVGIGTTAPGYKLDVAGTINTSLGGQYGNGCVRFGSHTLNSNSNGWLYIGDESTNVYGGRGIAMGNCYVASAFYYPNGSHGAGKVLVSDATGLASWSSSTPASNLDSRVSSFSETTASAAFVDISVSNFSLTTTGHSVLLFYTCDVECSAAATINFQFTCDGAAIAAGATGVEITVANTAQNVGMIGLKVTPSAGAHTYAVQWKTSAGTARLSNVTASETFIVVEQ